MKVKIFENVRKEALEEDVNDFTRKVEVIDIEYSVFVENGKAHYSIMVVYREME